MRISGGIARGIPLVVPKDDSVRPATDALRQAVFSSLGAWVAEAVFLDLFAGSGAYGLEALSRGASGGTFVEENARAVECLRRNLAAVCKSMKRDEAGLSVVQADALTVPLSERAVPEVVFIDPPYGVIDGIAEPLFARLTELLRSRPDPLIVFEMPGGHALEPAGWREVKRLGKGFRQPTAALFRRTP